jgi:hypothetical protein
MGTALAVKIIMRLLLTTFKTHSERAILCVIPSLVRPATLLLKRTLRVSYFL